MEKTEINRLIEEAVKMVPIMDVYNMALSYVDVAAMQAAGDITREELCANMALGGFCAGIRFTLENLETKDEGAQV